MRTAKADSTTLWGIADALLARGKMPTVRAVIEEAGGGSPNRIAPILREWRESRNLKSLPRSDREDVETWIRRFVDERDRRLALEKRLSEIERKLDEVQR